MYHGTPEERAELRRTVMRPIDPNDEGVDAQNDDPPPDTSSDGEQSDKDAEDSDEDERTQKAEDMGRGKRKRISTSRGYESLVPSSTRSSTRIAAKAGSAGQRSSRRVKKPISLLSSDEEDGTHKYDSAVDDEDDNEMGHYAPETKSKGKGKFKPSKTQKKKLARRKEPTEYQSVMTFPVVITTYEIIIRDRKHLGSTHYSWGYIVVDEGHRLKNLDCKLVREIKQYKSACRLILTGTPLHVSEQFSYTEDDMLKNILAE